LKTNAPPTRKYLQAHGYTGVDDLECSLNLMKADWWDPKQFRLNVIASLRKSKLWEFLTQ